MLETLLTVALLLLLPVMVWKCWNLAPVPLQRLWALGFGGMAAGMLYQFWRADAWRKESEKLELKLQELKHRRRQPTLPRTRSFSQSRSLLDCDGFEFRNLVARPSPRTLLLANFLHHTKSERCKRID